MQNSHPRTRPFAVLLCLQQRQIQTGWCLCVKKSQRPRTKHPLLRDRCFGLLSWFLSLSLHPVEVLFDTFKGSCARRIVYDRDMLDNNSHYKWKSINHHQTNDTIIIIICMCLINESVYRHTNTALLFQICQYSYFNTRRGNSRFCLDSSELGPFPNLAFSDEATWDVLILVGFQNLKHFTAVQHCLILETHSFLSKTCGTLKRFPTTLHD